MGKPTGIPEAVKAASLQVASLPAGHAVRFALMCLGVLGVSSRVSANPVEPSCPTPPTITRSAQGVEQDDTVADGAEAPRRGRVCGQVGQERDAGTRVGAPGGQSAVGSLHDERV
jgi:hypothetical protein